MSRKVFAISKAVLSASGTLSLLLTGCSSMSNFSTPLRSVTPATFSGKAHGGYNAISNATITLYAAGTAYGTSLTTFTPVTTTTDATGAWNFTGITCPTANTQMYVTAVGGNTAGTGYTSTNQNTAAVLVAALGPCSNDTATSHFINEATTVATIFAFQQFMSVSPYQSANPGTSGVLIGAPADTATTNLTTGLNNAYTTFLNLVDPVTGIPQQAFTPAGSVASITLTPETTKISTLANILATCINQTDSTGTACSTLMTNAVPPTYATTQQGTPTAPATDTAMATYYLATNPTQAQDGTTTRNSNLYSMLTGASNPFGINLSAAPLDWTLGITYTSATANTCTAGAATTKVFNLPRSVAIDSTGNVWMLNASNSSTAVNANAVVEFSPGGTVLGCYDGTVASTGSGVQMQNNILVDMNNNVWYGAQGYTVSGSLTGNAMREIANTSTTPTVINWPLPNSTVMPFQIATDKAGDIFMGDYVINGTASGLWEYVGVSSATTVQSTADATTPHSMGTTVTTGRPVTMAAIYSPTTANVSAPYIYTTGYTATVSTTYNLSTPALNTTTPGNPPYTYTTVAGSGSGSTTVERSAPMAADNNGKLAGANVGGALSSPYSKWWNMIPPHAVLADGALSAQFAGGLNSAGGFAVDGINNYWASLISPAVAAVTGPPATPAIYGFAEVTGDGNFTPLSPAATGATSCTSTLCPAGGSFQRPNVGGQEYGMAIDPSGNVWAAYGSSVNTPGTTNGVVEIVGAAAPVSTPIVNSLK